jgi:muconate cycloisomerase
MMLGSGLTDPDLSLAAALHVFAHAGVIHPCALNGPQFLAHRHADGINITADIVSIPTGPGLGLTMDAAVEATLSIAAEAM